MVFGTVILLLLITVLILWFTGYSVLNAFLYRISRGRLRVKTITPFRWYGIEVLVAGWSIHIHSLRFIFFPSQFSKPLLVSLHDVRIERTWNEEEEEGAEEKEEEGISDEVAKTKIRKYLNYAGGLGQYVAVSLDNAHLIFLHSGAGVMLHFTLDDIRFEVFRGPRSWQCEFAIRLSQGKALERASPSPPLAEFSLGSSLSFDSSRDFVTLNLNDPLLSMSHRGLEIVSELELVKSRRKKTRTKRTGGMGREMVRLVSSLHLDLILSAITLRYSAIVDGECRQLSLTASRTTLSRRGELFQFAIGDMALIEQGRRSTVRSANISVDVKASTTMRDIRVFTADVRTVVCLADMVQWRGVVESFEGMKRRMEETKDSDGEEGKERPSSLPVASTHGVCLSILAEVSHLGCTLIGLDGKEWSLVAKLLTVSKLNHTSLEIAVDEVWLNRSGAVPRMGIHEWGEVVRVGAAVVEFVNDDTSGRKMVIAADDCKVEWSEEVIGQVTAIVKELGVGRRRGKGEEEEEGGGDEGVKRRMRRDRRGAITVEATMRRAAVVVSARDTSMMAVAVDELTIRGKDVEWNIRGKEGRIVSGPRDKEGVRMERMKKAHRIAMPSWSQCRDESAPWKQKEHEDRWKVVRKAMFGRQRMSLNGDVPRLELSIKPGQEATLQLEQSAFLAWSPLLHAIALHVFRTTKGLLSALSPSPTPSSSHLSPRPPPSTRFALVAGDDVQVDLELPQYHIMSWRAPVVQCEVSARREVTVIAPSLTVLFDQVEFLNVTDVCISRRLHDARMDSLRATDAEMMTATNKLWSWTAERLHFFLPFAFNFAACFDEFITVIKWMRMMSGKRSGRPIDPVLATDLHVLIQEAILELEDDPFERKLQTNHELMEDEVFECERRRQVLADHLATRYRNIPLTSQAKIRDELNACLLKENSSIYIKRHTKQGENVAPLFRSSWKKLEFRALADESMRRDEQCILLMRMMDEKAPLPPGIEWTTLWGRAVHISMDEWTAQLREYPIPYMLTKNLHIFGRVVAAERLSQGGRSLRERPVPLPHPWQTLTVHRNISTLKLFYDLSAESEEMTMNYGPCWEPALSMLSLQWNNISTPSRDPSPLLPFWDKMRFLLHGRLLWSSKRLVTSMLASLDPFNTAEMLEWVWADWGLEWNQGEILTRASLEIFLRTASRYDDSRLLYLPRVNLRVEMEWNCLGQPYDHHAVELCTADKLPHSATEHDSYRSFRSLSLNVLLNLVVHSEGNKEPRVLLFAQCVRCLDQLFKTISRTNGNTRRGKVFGVPPFGKKQLSKHFRDVQISIKLPSFDVSYFMSQSSPQGLRLSCDQVELVSSLVQSAQTPADDKLRRRTLMQWSVDYVSATLGETQVHVLGVEAPPSPGAPPRPSKPLLSFSRVVHISEKGGGPSAPQMRLTVHELRLSWTAAQRDVCLVMAEGLRRAALLRSVLALHLSAVLKIASEEKRRQENRGKKEGRSGYRWEEEGGGAGEEEGDEPNLLDKLIEEADTKKVAHCEQSMELPSGSLQGISQANADDVTGIAWHIELVNSQMMLSGDAGKFVLLAASRATLSQKIHRAVWRNAQLLSKKSWSALLNGMQYFAPISESSWEGETRSWLPREVIEDRGFGGESSTERMASLLGGGTGEAVGGIVESESRGQLQRIISRCSCQIYWVSYSEELEDDDKESLMESTVEDTEENAEGTAVDCITLKHNMIEASSNGEQYSLAVDLVNQLVLFVDPRMKENAEKRNRRLFECRQQSMEDMIRSIETQQAKLREVVCVVRSLERQLFHSDGKISDTERATLLRDMDEYKTKQLDVAEHLAITVSVLKQRQVEQTRVGRATMEEEVPVVRKFEVCFEDCTWKLTETDGMITIAQLHITNFLYTRTMRVDNGGEHLFEVGTVRMTNLLPNSPFPDTLDRDSRYPSTEAAMRVVCKDLAPVGGIAVKEHFEVNIAPMVVQFTYRFFDSMMSFFFPERNKQANEINLDTDEAEKPQRRLSLSRRITGGLSMVRSSGRGTTPSTAAVDDIDRMRRRAETNNLFLYIKIPEVPILVSYKGNKEKNIEDVRNLSLIFPLCEYHEKNWTWLDLSIAVKQRCRRVLLQQFMKQKLLRNRMKEDMQPTSDEDKKRIAIGNTSMLLEKQKK